MFRAPISSQVLALALAAMALLAADASAAPVPLVQQGAKLTMGEETGGGNAGYSVAVSADGNTVLVGGPADNGRRGAAWVFTRSAGAWSQQAKLTAAGESAKRCPWHQRRPLGRWQHGLRGCPRRRILRQARLGACVHPHGNHLDGNPEARSGTRQRERRIRHQRGHRRRRQRSGCRRPGLRRSPGYRLDTAELWRRLVADRGTRQLRRTRRTLGGLLETGRTVPG